MTEKNLPFTKEFLEKIEEEFPTPFYVYDEKAIRENARALNKVFSWHDGFREFFAVKATPNPHILKILADEGFGADCSSLSELLLAEKTGITGEYIMFSSNETPIDEYVKAKEMGGIANLDDITHIEFIDARIGLPDLVSFRYNPGPLREGNSIIGNPEDAKYGFTREQLFEGYRILQQKGVKRFGLHTMVASNELNPQYFIDTAIMLFELAVELDQKLAIRLDFVNIGGGIGIPYKPEQDAVDMQFVSDGIKTAYHNIIEKNGLDPIRFFMEAGRIITGPYGYLVTRAIHKKETYKNYIGLNASMANLMRPGMYEAYHHITIPGKEDQTKEHIYDVVGSLCENNDKFAIDRKLAKIDIGDFVVIHDCGAHGHSMGFNYNGKLRSAELLLQEDGSVRMIRRAETVDDHFATLDFTKL